VGRPVPAAGRRALWRLALPLALVLAGSLAGAGAVGAATPSPSPPVPPRSVTLVLFWGDGCPKCKAERALLAELTERYPRLRVRQYEVWNDADNRAYFERYAEQRGVSAQAVPTTFVGERVWVGFTDEVGADIQRTVRAALAGREPTGQGAGGGTCKVDEGASCKVRPEGGVDSTVNVPGIGDVDLGGRSLVLSTLVIGALDGINPCSLWVISILLAMVLRTGSRRRVLAVGSMFLFVTAGLYALYIGGVYTALAYVAVLGWIQLVVAAVAGGFGAVNVKDYFWPKRGVSMSIPESGKPGIYRRIRTVAASGSLPMALGATVVLAAGVSLLETPCTAGFPVLWASLLSANDVGFAQAAGLFVLYMVPFLADELLVFGAAVLTMRAAKLQEKHGRVLKLLGGTVMLTLAVVMLVDPELMNSVVGATLVFAGAIGLAVLVHVTYGRLHRPRPDHPTAVGDASRVG
jgi:thiol-disulfide isomerase/thioredoxin